jgi:hypothetical protein
MYACGEQSSWFYCKKYPAVAGYLMKKRAIVVDVLAINNPAKDFFKFKCGCSGNKVGLWFLKIDGCSDIFWSRWLG